MIKSSKELSQKKEMTKCASGLLLSLGLAYAVIFCVFHFFYPNENNPNTALAFSAFFLYAYSLSSLVVYFKIYKTKPKFITVFYLANKMLRFVVSLLIILLYALFITDTIMLFALEFFLLYLITLIFESGQFYLLESKTKNKE